jgi:ribosomal protein L24
MTIEFTPADLEKRVHVHTGEHKGKRGKVAMTVPAAGVCVQFDDGTHASVKHEDLEIEAQPAVST